MDCRLIVVSLLVIPCLLVGAGEPARRKLVVGTKQTAPFSMKGAAGWSGVSIDLWKAIAKDLDLDYEFQERDLKGLIQGLEDGSLDVSVAALTVTDKREETIDFTHPFYTSGLGIAVRARQEADFKTILTNIFTAGFIKAFMLLFMTLFCAGFLVWVFEAKNEAFGYGFMGLFNSFYWSATTHTTVGFGDLVPKTIPGRIIAMMWMVLSVLIIATLTGRVSSSMTTTELAAGVRGPKDLADVRVATVKHSSCEDHLIERGISDYEVYPTVTAAMDALLMGDVDAVVYDAPLLKYRAKHSKGQLMVLPHVLVRQDYGIGLKTNSTLREPINRLLLKKINSSKWKKITSKYLGE